MRISSSQHKRGHNRGKRDQPAVAKHDIISLPNCQLTQ
jgi:hypothetical protein